jgi:hypothetical protein
VHQLLAISQGKGRLGDDRVVLKPFPVISRSCRRVRTANWFSIHFRERWTCHPANNARM